MLNSATKVKINKLNTNVSEQTLMNFDNLILNDRSLSVYPVSSDFNLLTLTVFPILRN